MAVYVIMEAEASLENYDKVGEKLDVENNPPAGLILHATADIGGGKLKNIDIWESAEASQRFYQERLGPAVSEVTGAGAPPPAPPEMGEIYDLVRP